MRNANHMEDLEEPVYCSKCQGKTNHKIILSYKEKSEQDADFHWHDNYYIVKCAGCNKKAFVHQYGDEDMWEYIDGQRKWVDEFKVYPEEPPSPKFKESLKKPMSFSNLPPNLKNYIFR